MGGGGTSNSNWVQTTWNFSDGSQTSYILNRTDAEYQNYIAPIRAQCLTIPKSKFGWRPGSGSQDNWREFGIPDCSGSGSSVTGYQGGSCPSGQYWYYPAGATTGGYCKSSETIWPGGSGSTGSCPADIIKLLGDGCHNMSSAWFDGSMSRYVLTGTAEVKSCSVAYVQGCPGSSSGSPTSYRAPNSTAQLGNIVDGVMKFFKNRQ